MNLMYESWNWCIQCHYFSLGNMVHIEWLIFSFLLLDFPQPKTVGYTISWLYKYERNCLITFIFEYNDIIYCVNHICHAWAVMIEMTCIPLRRNTVNITTNHARGSFFYFGMHEKTSLPLNIMWMPKYYERIHSRSKYNLVQHYRHYLKL